LSTKLKEACIQLNIFRQVNRIFEQNNSRQLGSAPNNGSGTGVCM